MTWGVCFRVTKDANVCSRSTKADDATNSVNTNQSSLSFLFDTSTLPSNPCRTMFRALVSKIFMGLLVLQSVAAFAPRDSNRFAPSLETSAKPLEKLSQVMTTTAVVVATSPLVAMAEEADDYEYGAVNAPIGIAWAGGVLAVLTALLPLALQGGEDAFNEMKDRDADKWGTGQTDALSRRRRR